MTSYETVVYLNDGDTYIGIRPLKDLTYWKKYGVQQNMKYLYKGWRHNNTNTQQVVVFSNKNWSAEERTKRKNNGFMGIKFYEL